MAMLAEPKRKQHWTLNPRGKQWSEDSNKFGQKMLEKMGWTSGKGLGPKGLGMVEHIRVKVKNDQVGIGYDKNCDNQWTAQQDEFNKFLQNLQTEESNNIVENKISTVKSLEEKSKTSQKRVHYKKFTRGKDVNRYNTKDLANIFGKKDFNDEYIHKPKEDKKICDPIGKQDTTAGILTIKGGCINDYFKTRNNTGEKSDTAPDIENYESDKEKYCGFGYQEKSENNFNTNDNFNSAVKTSENNYKCSRFSLTKCDEIKPKKKKHNDLNYVFDNPCLDLNILDENESIRTKDFEKKTSKKRKHQLISQNTIEGSNNSEELVFKKQKNNVYINEGLDLDYPEKSISTDKMDIKIKSEATPEQLDSKMKSTNISRKSKKKNKFEVSSNAYDNIGLDLDCSDSAAKKKVEKQNNCETIANAYDNIGLDLDCSDSAAKKKVEKQSNCETIANAYDNLALDINSSITKNSEEHTDVKDLLNQNLPPKIIREHSNKSKQKETKKYKKNKLLYNGVDNYGLDINCSINDISTPKFKDSKDCHEIKITSPNLTKQKINNEDANFPYEIECNKETTKKKKKKKKKSKLDEVVIQTNENKNKSVVSTAFVNEALDIEIINNEVCIEPIQTNCKRKKNRRISVLETIEEVPEEKTIINVPDDELKDLTENLEIQNKLESKSKLEIGTENSQVKNPKNNQGIVIKKIIPVSESIYLSNQRGKEIQIIKEIIKIKKKKVLEVDSSTKVQTLDNKINIEKENICSSKDGMKTASCEKSSNKVKKIEGENSITKCFHKNGLEGITDVHVDQKVESPLNENEKKSAQREERFKKNENLSSYQKYIKSKEIMKSLFIKNPTLLFNGSNINEIRGYGIVNPSN